MVNWEKLNAAADKFLKAENYIKEPYTGTLKAMYPHETDKGQQVINLDFQEGSSLSLFGASYRNDDGSYPMGLGSFIKSCEALKIEFQGAYEDGILQGVRLVKDGKDVTESKVTIRGISNKKVGDDNQTVEKFGWGILEKIEVVTKTAGETVTETRKEKPGKLPKTQTKEPDPEPTDLKDAWETALMELAAEPKSAKDIQLGLKNVVSDAKLRKAMSDVRDATFKVLADESKIIVENGKIQWAI